VGPERLRLPAAHRVASLQLRTASLRSCAPARWCRRGLPRPGPTGSDDSPTFRSKRP